MCSPLNTLCVLCVWCVPGMSVLLNWDGAAFSCHHVHSKSRGGQTERWDDTADPPISLSPVVNSNLARLGPRIPPLPVGLQQQEHTDAQQRPDHLSRCSFQSQVSNLLLWFTSNSTLEQSCLFNLETSKNFIINPHVFDSRSTTAGLCRARARGAWKRLWVDGTHCIEVGPRNGNPPRSEATNKKARVNIYGCWTCGTLLYPLIWATGPPPDYMAFQRSQKEPEGQLACFRCCEAPRLLKTFHRFTSAFVS